MRVDEDLVAASKDVLSSRELRRSGAGGVGLEASAEDSAGSGVRSQISLRRGRSRTSQSHSCANVPNGADEGQVVTIVKELDLDRHIVQVHPGSSSRSKLDGSDVGRGKSKEIIGRGDGFQREYREDDRIY